MQVTSASLCKHRFIFRKFHRGNASFISSLRPCDFTRTVLGHITMFESLFSHSVGFHLQVEFTVHNQAKSRALITGRISFENLHFTRSRAKSHAPIMTTYKQRCRSYQRNLAANISRRRGLPADIPAYPPLGGRYAAHETCQRSQRLLFR